MKKLVSILLSMGLAASMLAGCGSTDSASTSTGSSASGTESASASAEAVSASDLKVGVVYIGDENEGYTAAHMAGIDDMQAALGLSDDQIIEKTLIPEDETSLDAVLDLVDQGCNLVIGTSFGYETYMLQAAAEYPDVQFCHTTGYQAASSGLSNMHNAFNSIYEARYVSGVVAGMKLAEMLESGEITEAKIGYVGAYPYAEVVSGYTSFYLGAKSVCPSVTMEVQYTNSWGDMAGENEVASQLIADGCVLIGQHADTTGAPTAAQDAGVMCVGYNVDMRSVAPDSALTSAASDWGAYYTYIGECMVNGEAIATDWSKGFSDDAVYITDLNENTVAAGTADKVDEVIAAIKDGSLHVFDTTTFTVNGSSIEDLIEEGGEFADYSTYVYDGYFHEQEIGSAPAFDLRIDGITEKTN